MSPTGKAVPPEKHAAGRKRLRGSAEGWVLNLALVGIMVLSVLLLPPFSLGRWLSGRYTADPTISESATASIPPSDLFSGHEDSTKPTSTAAMQVQPTVRVVQDVPTPTPTAEPTQMPAPTLTLEPTPTFTATPEPTPTVMQAVAPADTDIATVNSDVLNLRAGPGTHYAVLGQVRRGDKLRILGKDPSETWLKVAAPDGAEAWVILTYVRIRANLPGVPLVEVPPTPTSAPQPTRPVNVPPSAPPPGDTAFGYGIQAHEDTGRVAQAVNDLGFGWLKQQVRWADVEGAKGTYGWSGLDNIADTAHAAGIKVMFSVVGAPSWARSGMSGHHGPPANYQDLVDFMGAMAARFRGRVQAYEVWNEQNLSREWEGAALSAADYVRLLKGAYAAIKAADPNAVVVSGAPTPTGISDHVTAIDDRLYLQQMYNAGLKYYCDAVGAHPSGYANPPDVYYTPRAGGLDPHRGYDDHPSFFFRNTIEDYYNIMAANGDGAKRVWATEFGWPTNDGMGVPPSPNYEFAADISEQQQANYIVRAYIWSRNWGHAGVMFLWNLNFWPAAGAQDEKAKYGIVRGDWSPRPAYIALRNMPK